VILDTNALSAVADDEPAVVRVYRQAASMELPVIVLGEYRFGIGQSRRRGEYEKWLRELIGATRVLVVEEETSRHYAGIRAALKKAGRPIPSNDLWIAALCRQHRLPLLSQDQHFDAVEGLERDTIVLRIPVPPMAEVVKRELPALKRAIAAVTGRTLDVRVVSGASAPPPQTGVTDDGGEEPPDDLMRYALDTLPTDTREGSRTR